MLCTKASKFIFLLAESEFELVQLPNVEINVASVLFTYFANIGHF